MKAVSYLFLTIVVCLGLEEGTAFRRVSACQVSSSAPSLRKTSDSDCHENVALQLRGGGWIIPGGYNPFGYKITALGEEFLAYEGSLDADLGRFLASLKKRKTKAALKENWVEVVRVAKNRQSMVSP
jgi:hypothetical protein